MAFTCHAPPVNSPRTLQELSSHHSTNFHYSDSKYNRTSTMCGTCFSPPAAAPESVGTPTAPSIEINSDVDSCCDGDGSLPDEAQSHAGVQAVNLDDCCSAGSRKDTAPKDQADAPDCCRDKVGPCCDASCIDRLAMRECSINSAASSSDPGRKSNGEPLLCATYL